jgi:hypothetical protein
MKSVTQRDADRVAFLIAAYELVGGSARSRTHGREVIPRAGIELEDEHEAADLQDHMRSRGLLSAETLDGSFGLSAQGIAEAERLIRQRGPALVPLPLVLTVDEYRAVERFLHDYRQARDGDDDLGLAPEELADADAQIATIDAQMKSPKPRRRILGATFRVFTEVGSNAGGNAIWEGAKVLAKLLGV